MHRACLRDTTHVRRVYCINIVGVAAIILLCKFCSIDGAAITKSSHQDVDSFTTPSQNESDMILGVSISQLSEQSTDGKIQMEKRDNNNSTAIHFSKRNISTTMSYFEDVSLRNKTDSDDDGVINTVETVNNVTTSTAEHITEISTKSMHVSHEDSKKFHNTDAKMSTVDARNAATSYDDILEINYNATQNSFDVISHSSPENVDHISAPPSTHKTVQNVQKIATELKLVQHYTEFIKTNWIAEKQRHHAVDHHLNLIPIEDGPFGSLIWRDKKYLISVIIPIGVGIAGAVFIVVMAYAVRYCHRGDQTSPSSPVHLPHVSMNSTPRTDQVILLADSSDDEF